MEGRNKKNIVIALLGAIILGMGGFWLFSASAEAAAGINRQINFQGKVTNTDGTNVANGSYTFLFCLYTTGSPATACTSGANNDAVWRESKSITVTDGIFQSDLGDTTTLPGSVDFNTDNIYLGINFNANGQMTPLVRFTAAPYAMNADKVHGLTVTDTTGTLTVANGRTVSFADAFTTSGAFATTLTVSGITNATLPSGTITLADLATAQSLTNKTIGSTGLVFSAATTDITTASGEDLTLTAAGAGIISLSDSVSITGTSLTATSATTVTLGSTGADTITIGNAGADTITIGNVASTGVSIVDNNWSVTAAGVASFITGSVIGSQTFTTNNIADSGALTIASGTASALTLNSGTTGTINIGTDASAETINIGNTGAAAKIVNIGDSAQTNTVTIGSATATTVSITDNNWSVTAAGAASFASATITGALAANGGITFDAGTDTVGAHTLAGTIDANTNILTNIGNAGTDFIASTGALTLAGVLTANGGVSLAASQSLTAGAASFVDLASVTHGTTANQGLRLPQAASATPSNPTSGEGYIAWDAAGNQLITYNGTAWAAVGGTIADDSLDFTKFLDAMALDASTDIAIDGAEVFSLTNTGTGNSFVVNDEAADATPFVIDAAGLVGIGTSSPTNSLDIIDTTVGGGIMVSGNNAKAIVIDSSDSSAYLALERGNTSARSMVTFYDAGGNSRFGVGLDADATSNFYISDSSYAIKYFTILQSNGNIGIGDYTPEGKLDFDLTSTSTTGATEYGANFTVTDTGIVTTGTDTTYGEYLTVTRTGATGGTINTYGQNISVTGSTGGTSTVTGLNVAVSGADTNYAALFNGGNVGIGTSTPEFPLSIESGGMDSFRSRHTDFSEFAIIHSSAGVEFMVNGGSGVPGDLQFYSGGYQGLSPSGTANMIITQAGLVGIGGSTPSYLLDVSRIGTGSTFASASYVDDTFIDYYSRLNIYHSSGGVTLATQGDNGTPGNLNFSNGATDLMTILETGEVGIGDGTPDGKFDFDLISTSTTGVTEYGANFTITDTGIVTTGTDTTYGESIAVTRTGATGGTITTYGQNISVTGDAGGASTNYGLRVAVSGADTNYAASFTGGGVRVGTTTGDTNVPFYAVSGGTPFGNGSFGGGTVAAFQNSGSAGDKASVSLISGSTGTSEIVFGNSATSGIGYMNYTVANGFGFYVNGSGTASAVLNASGNLGIGATTTSAKLDVVGGANAITIEGSGYSLTGANAQSMVDLSGTWNTTGTPTLIKANVTDTASNSNARLLDLRVDDTPMFYVSKWGVAYAQGFVSYGDIYAENVIASGYMTATTFGAQTGQYTTAASTNMSFYPNDGSGTVAMTILSSNGNVGIGDTTPTNQLDLLSSGAAHSGIIITNTNAGNYNPIMQFELTENTPLFTLGVDDADGDKFKIAAGSDISGTSQFTIDSTGVTSIANLSLGAMGFDTNAGIVSWMDMPVTGSAGSGTVESYSAQIDGTSFLTVYAQSDGAGALLTAQSAVKSDVQLDATADGLATKVVAGNCSDTNFNRDTNGLLCIDSTGGSERLYFREGGAWNYIAKTGGFQIPNYETAPQADLTNRAEDSLEQNMEDISHYPQYLTDRMQPGELLIPYVDEYLSDGAVHGLYARFTDVKDKMFAEENTALAALSLKTDQNVTTLAGLQTSIDAELSVAGAKLDTLAASDVASDARFLADETRLSAVEALAEQFALDANAQATKTAALETQMQTFTAQMQTLMDFYTAFDLGGIVAKDALGNVDIMDGKFKARIVETGALVIEVSDPDASTIGTAIICPVAVDADSDGKDDCSGIDMTDADAVAAQDGTSAQVMTRAMIPMVQGSRVFTTFKDNPNAFSWIEKTKDKDGDYVGFKIRLDKPVVGKVKVDWLLVEQK